MKNVYTIPPDIAFVEALAKGIGQQAETDSFKLADRLILLPTRRACRHLREAFLKNITSHAALLPRMRPLGDLDEDELYFGGEDLNPAIPPAISSLRRQLLLTQLIKRKDGNLPIDQAAQLASALGKLLDQVQIEGCDFSALHRLVPENLAEHWQQTLKFLEILTDAWPEMLAEEGCLDPAERRNRLLAAQAAAWQANPPQYPVIAAGSTGSIPATAHLLDIIASMPQGAVVLPGLDQELAEDAWQKIEETHPQYGMKKLLEEFETSRGNVRDWLCNYAQPDSPPLAGGVRGGVQKTEVVDPSPAKTKALSSDNAKFLQPLPQGERKNALRVRLLQESMRPADVTDAWRELDADQIPREALAGLTRVECDHPQEEAQTIALMMRHALETPEKTVALVTPDRSLAERVVAALARWNIEANDSAGTSLAAQPVGGFLLDVLAAASPDATPIDYLSLLKHPFSACGLAPAECRAHARQAEMAIWRKVIGATGDGEQEIRDWFDQLKLKFQPITTNWFNSLPLAERIETHIALAEQLAASDQESGASRLWRGETGEAAATWLNDWKSAAHDFPPLNGEEYLRLFAGLLRDVTVRPTYGQHPRLSIYGLLEARLIQADLMMLGGLNEGVWPPEAEADPWMSRPMKRDFGLPLPERRIGLSAHDFVQLASAPEVVLTRSKRVGNAPSVPSRFLLQLETVLQALGYHSEKHDALAPSQPWQAWAHRLDEPETIKPCAAPAPCPAADKRPKKLSVTEIGTWRRNPYAIYARHILDLRKLDPLEADISAADRGTIIHKALESFLRKFPDALPPHALEKLIDIGREVFSAYKDWPQVAAFWWPRFEQIAKWFVAEEHERRANGIKTIKVEAKGEMAFANGAFTLKGRADRIDRLPGGTLAIIDYKTGKAPTKKDINAGYEPQLPLLAVMAAEGCFKDIPAAQVSEIAHWLLKGGAEIADQQPVTKNIQSLADAARQGLEELIAAFADPATPYEVMPKPYLRPRYDDYEHLARLAEWGAAGGDA